MVCYSLPHLCSQEYFSLGGSYRRKLVVHVIPTKTAGTEPAEETDGGREEVDGGGHKEGSRLTQAGQEGGGLEGEGGRGTEGGEEDTDSGGPVLPQVSVKLNV